MTSTVLLTGQIEDRPVRRIEDGTLVATFRLVTVEAYTDDFGRHRELTDYHDVELLGRLAETARDLKPGDWVRLRGRLALTLHLEPFDFIEVQVRAQDFERLAAPAQPDNAVRFTGVLYGEPVPIPALDVPTTYLTLAPPARPGRQGAAWPDSVLRGYAVGGLAVELARLPHGTPLVLRGRLRTNTRGPVDPTDVQSVHLAATARS